MTFEGEQFMGQEAIFGKLTSFGELAFKINNSDIQPTVNDGIFIFVTGELSIDGGPGMMYSQTFILQKGGAFGYYVFNTIFRLNLV